MDRTRLKQAAFGLATDLSGQALVILVTFTAIPIYLGLTSKAIYGFWLTITSVVGYLTLSEFGLSTSLLRRVASLSSPASLPQINKVASSAFYSLSGVGVAFITIGFALAPCLPKWLGLTGEDQKAVITAYLITVAAGALAVPLSCFNALVVGAHRMAIDNTVRCIASLGGVALTLILLWLRYGILALAIGQAFTLIATNTIACVYALRLFPGLRLKLSLVDRGELRELWRFGGYLQLGRTANTVAVNTDSIVITANLGAAAVAPYVLSSKLATLFSISIASKLPSALLPAASELFAQGATAKLQTIYLRLSCYVVRLAAVGACYVAIVNQYFVSLWVGPDLYGGPMLTAIFVYWVFQDTIYRGTAGIAFATGDLRAWSIASIFEAVINLLASIILVRVMGVVGVALGTSIGKTFTTGWYIPYWVCRKLNLPVKAYLSNGIVVPALRSIPGCAITLFISWILPWHGTWLWVFLIGVTAALSNVLCFEVAQLLRPSPVSMQLRFRRLFTMAEK